MYSLARLSEQPNKRTPEKCLFSGVLAHLRGFEPLAYRLGVENVHANTFPFISQLGKKAEFSGVIVPSQYI